MVGLTTNNYGGKKSKVTKRQKLKANSVGPLLKDMFISVKCTIVKKLLTRGGDKGPKP